jgi:hypothetical protein
LRLERKLIFSVFISKLALLPEGNTAGMSNFFYIAMIAMKYDKSILHANWIVG